MSLGGRKKTFEKLQLTKEMRGKAQLGLRHGTRHFELRTIATRGGGAVQKVGGGGGGGRLGVGMNGGVGVFDKEYPS